MDAWEAARQRFLRILVERSPDGAARKDLPPADRRNDKVRQSLRREGLIAFRDAGLGLRWHITEAGEEYLRDHA